MTENLGMDTNAFFQLSLKPNNQNSSKDLQSSNQESTKKQNTSARILFLGAGKVGKSSIIHRFIENKFEEKYTPTVEDIHFHKFIVRDRLVPVEFVDTSGSLQFPVMLRLWIKKATAFIIVFANDSADSLNEAGELLTQIKTNRDDWLEKQAITPPLVVVCNKSDIPTKNGNHTATDGRGEMIGEDTIMDWLLKHELKPIQFVYASAKTNDSINAIFESLWTQNEMSQTMEFEYWETKRRVSTTGGEEQLITHSSWSNSTGPSHRGSVSDLRETSVQAETKTPFGRSNLFRGSLRLNRRSSAKAAKTLPKPELTRLECVIS